MKSDTLTNQPRQTQMKRSFSKGELDKVDELRNYKQNPTFHSV